MDAHFPEVALPEAAPADPRSQHDADPESQPRTNVAGDGASTSPPFDPAALMDRAAQENFPVASRLLGGALRDDLLALYGFARLTDELGDTLDGDRASALDWLEGELDRAYAGTAEHPLLRALTPTLRAHELPRAPFLRLIAANRVDQERDRYESFDELLDYCSLSANPVGELVLGVLGLATPERVALSDLICSGLQIAEHLQDVAEDRRSGRIYLPQRDMLRFGVTEAELDETRVSPALRELLAFEADRARAMLLGGRPLLATLPWRPRLAVGAYLGGGLAALDAVEGARYEVLAGPPRANDRARLRVSAKVIARSLLSQDPVTAPRGSPAPAVPPAPAGSPAASSSVPRLHTTSPDSLARAAAIDAAYEACERITRREARNFYYGIRLLPGAKRRAMCAVYALARRVDDIGDGDLATPEKLSRLDALSDELAHTLDGGRARSVPAPGGELENDPVLLALADARWRFDLPLDALTELVEGVRMDARAVRYDRFEELLLYCHRVAGGIGRLCLAIFGVKDPRAATWAESAADELGVAMQLTNILRDLREDAERGRLYLPREDVMGFGLAADGEPPERLLALFASGVPEPQLRALVDFEVARAREWFARGASLLPQLDRRSAACVLAMVGIYGRLLERIAERPAAALESRLSLPATEKAWVAARSLLGALA